MILTKEELLEIKGGTISSTMLNSIAKVGTFILELGRALGSAIRRTTTGTNCPL